MLAEQLSHKFWLALDRPKGSTVSVTFGNVTVTAHIRTRDAFSCLAERLIVQFSTTAEWEAIVETSEKGLQALHRDFRLVERDDVYHQALFRSPVNREVYWEATLAHSSECTLSVQRYRLQSEGQRTLEPFVLTEEQLAEFLSSLLLPQESPAARE